MGWALQAPPTAASSRRPRWWRVATGRPRRRCRLMRHSGPPAAAAVTGAVRAQHAESSLDRDDLDEQRRLTWRQPLICSTKCSSEASRAGLRTSRRRSKARYPRYAAR
ncbi:hypothetical protein GUJ93_ZPchr0013g36508 [Zizania palustris]|uniref:Uncharacterized protein n=1 Tax=Zizania palustris TaxID=103762 RepID=A0A8J6C0K4_ZIZPA|nr:hypothetical protein GUJ93_ZPchr0013g36508 [Zizania palustris]